MPLTKPTGNSTTTLTGNKDLSCLRCRKKKAKCSKTRPACTRCARSNQLCEYPDAPPNLSDLSQKVLGLYDTLRELEDQFVTQYGGKDKQEPRSSPCVSSEMPSIETLSLQQPAKRLKQSASTPSPPTSIMDEGALPGNWSMTLTSEGLTLHAVARNIIEFTSFAKDFSQQLQYNNRTDTKLWEWLDDEEVEDDGDPLEEDEYLVTVPVYSIAPLLGAVEAQQHECISTDSNDGTLYEHISPYLSSIRADLRLFYETLENDRFPTHQFHTVILLRHMQPFIPLDGPTPTSPTALLCLCTAYATVASFLPVPHTTHIPSLADECSKYASGLLVELALQRQTNPRPIGIGAILLTSIRKASMIHLAVRTLCASCEWDHNEEEWQELAAVILYFEGYISAFYGWQDLGEAKDWLLQAANRLPANEVNTASALGLEAQLVCFLKQVLSLFYCHGSDSPDIIGMRKVDVDDVLNLVRDIETWEQRLPQWVQWLSAPDESDQHVLLLKMHIHMIHNIVKILLFRPFSGPFAGHDDSELQTHTRTTFLDLSMVSVERLAVCIPYFKTDDNWSRSGRYLGRDVIDRIRQAFPCDEELIQRLGETKKRLE